MLPCWRCATPHPPPPKPLEPRKPEDPHPVEPDKQLGVGTGV